MKRNYVKPTMATETFSANEYFTACKGVKCSAGERGYKCSTYISLGMFGGICQHRETDYPDNHPYILTDGDDGNGRYVAEYGPCNHPYDVEDDSSFKMGTLTHEHDSKIKIPVWYWVDGSGGDGIHCIPRTSDAVETVRS